MSNRWIFRWALLGACLGLLLLLKLLPARGDDPATRSDNPATFPTGDIPDEPFPL